MNIANSSPNSSFTANSAVPVERYFLYSFNTILSIVGILGNSSIVFIICRFPQLRKNCRYLQAGLAAGDAIVCLGQLFNAIMDILTGRFGLRVIRWPCLLLSSPGAGSIIYSVIMTLFISLDRCYAILRPLKYYQCNKFKIFVASVSFALLVAVSCVVATFLDVDLYDYPQGCAGAASRSARMSQMINYCNTAAGGIVVIIYPFTLIVMKIKASKLAKSLSEGKDENTNSLFRRQMRATTSITYVIIATICLFVIPSAIVLILGNIGVHATYVKTAKTFVGLCLSVNASVNFIFYIWKDESMRSRLKEMLPCRKTQVSPVSQSGSRQPSSLARGSTTMRLR